MLNVFAINNFLANVGGGIKQKIEKKLCACSE